MASKTPKFKGIANPKMAEGMRELRRSNAAGTHDCRPKRQRSRQAAKTAAIRLGY